MQWVPFQFYTIEAVSALGLCTIVYGEAQVVIRVLTPVLIPHHPKKKKELQIGNNLSGGGA
jgi:hypothetical protein